MQRSSKHAFHNEAVFFFCRGTHSIDNVTSQFPFRPPSPCKWSSPKRRVTGTGQAAGAVLGLSSQCWTITPCLSGSVRPARCWTRGHIAGAAIGRHRRPGISVCGGSERHGRGAFGAGVGGFGGDWLTGEVDHQTVRRKLLKYHDLWIRHI